LIIEWPVKTAIVKIKPHYSNIQIEHYDLS
jgi:hypothetical protein